MRARFGLLGHMGSEGGEDKRSGRCIRGMHDEHVHVRQGHFLILYSTDDELCNSIAGEHNDVSRAWQARATKHEERRRGARI